jgi:hypothetical protein
MNICITEKSIQMESIFRNDVRNRFLLHIMCKDEMSHFHEEIIKSNKIFCINMIVYFTQDDQTLKNLNGTGILLFHILDVPWDTPWDR